MVLKLFKEEDYHPERDMENAVTKELQGKKVRSINIFLNGVGFRRYLILYEDVVDKEGLLTLKKENKSLLEKLKISEEDRGKKASLIIELNKKLKEGVLKKLKNTK